jgi:pimeloyl-ACP methyl ester carboxylesterase
MKRHFILIHGAWHGGWCWDGVIAGLEKAGYSAEAPTMPGHRPGDHRSDIRLEDYIGKIMETIEKQAEPVILVGHSSAGFLLQCVAARIPEKIEHLIFNNAFILPDGKCQFDLVPPDVAAGMTQAAKASPDNCIPVMEDFVRNNLMAGEPVEKQDQLLARLVPQPIALFSTPISIRGFEPGSFKKTVLYCRHDVSLPPGAFLGMAQALGQYDLIEVDLGHEGVFTSPDSIAAGLVKAVG